MVVIINLDTQADRDKFYNSTQWRKLRKEILERDNHECLWCKEQGLVTTDEDTVMVVDHIKELESYPELALEPDNLRVLCFYHHEVRHERIFEGNNVKKDKKWDDEWW